MPPSPVAPRPELGRDPMNPSVHLLNLQRPPLVPRAPASPSPDAGDSVHHPRPYALPFAYERADQLFGDISGCYTLEQSIGVLGLNQTTEDPVWSKILPNAVSEHFNTQYFNHNDQRNNTRASLCNGLPQLRFPVTLSR